MAKFSLTVFGKITKPATVLIEKISSAIGVLYEPTRIRRKAIANSDAKIIATKAKLAVQELTDRASRRLEYEAIREQSNIENIIKKTIPHVTSEIGPSKLNDDWLAFFLEKCKHTSEVDIQNIWANLLAGESNNPGSYSKRTISVLAAFDHTDAIAFSKLCNFCITGEAPIPIITDMTSKVYADNGVNFESLHHLESIGLIHINAAGYAEFDIPAIGTIECKYCDTKLSIDVSSIQPNRMPLGCVLFSPTGRELSTLTTPAFINDFLNHIDLFFRKNGAVLNVCDN